MGWGGRRARRKSRQGSDRRGCSLMRQKTEPSMCNVEVTAYLAWGWGGRGVLGSLTCENFRQKRQKNGMAAGDPLKNQGEH